MALAIISEANKLLLELLRLDDKKKRLFR